MTDYAAMIKWDILPYCNGEGLDIGCGDARPHDWFVGIDIKAGQTNRGPNQIRDARKLGEYFAPESQDFIFSSHLLNELEDWPAVLAGWWKLLKPNGYMILFMPIAKASEGVKECDKRMVVDAMQALRPWQLVEARENGAQFFQVYRKCDLPTDLTVIDPEKVCAVMKLGAHGDALWGSSVLSHLKEQGFFTILYTQDTGEEVLRHDPNIDRMYKFESRVPLEQLGDFMHWIDNKYKHHRILVECVEGTLLPAPSKIQYHFPKELRHKLMDHNYLEIHHMQGQVPMEPRVKFYPNEAEKAEANAFRATLTPYVVCLVPNGSSVSKMWPYASDLAKKLLERNDVSVVMLGDERGMNFKDLEDHKRFHKIGMSWSSRRCMTFVQLANVVVGQETGLLNCVSCDPEVRKVVLMTHSTKENLTRDWPNTATMIGKAPCFPCHRLHYGWEFCKKDETTQASLCQSTISVHDVLQEILPAITKKEQIAA